MRGGGGYGGDCCDGGGDGDGGGGGEDVGEGCGGDDDLQNIPECGCSQKSGRVAVVINISYTACSITNLV